MKRVVNLDNLVALKLHVPRIDNIPIYARVEGGVDDKEINRTDKWVAKTKSTYTSPSNIRRIFITHKHVWVHLYKPIVGISNKSLELEKGMTEDLKAIAKQIVTRQPINDVIYTVKGTGLSAIVKPWVCANVEEIYFDWMVLIGNTALNSGYGDIILDCLINAKAPPEDVIKALFINECANGLDLRTRFPRLRTVGFIYNLDEVYPNIPKKPGVKSIEDLKSTWAENNIIMSLAKQGSARILKIGNNSGLSTARIVKTNTYEFDRVVLERYFNELEDIINKHKANIISKTKVKIGKEIEPEYSDNAIEDTDYTDENIDNTDGENSGSVDINKEDATKKILSKYNQNDINSLQSVIQLAEEVRVDAGVSASSDLYKITVRNASKQDRAALFALMNKDEQDAYRGVIMYE